MELLKRKPLRLNHYDYSQNGYYFITLCTENKNYIFGQIVDGVMLLNEYGKIAEKHFDYMNNLYYDIFVDCMIVMPNHIHFILAICRERIVCVPQENENNRTKMLLSKIIQQFKSSVTKDCNKILENGTHTMRSLQQTLWQKSYYEHIIRNEKELFEIREYIVNNPQKWKTDKYFE